jgi:hypothetical protein
LEAGQLGLDDSAEEGVGIRCIAAVWLRNQCFQRRGNEQTMVLIFEVFYAQTPTFFTDTKSLPLDEALRTGALVFSSPKKSSTAGIESIDDSLRKQVGGHVVDS